MAFSERLKDLRTKRGLSQAKLAQITGIEKAAIGRWETTSIVPTEANMRKLAVGLGLPYEDLKSPPLNRLTDQDIEKVFQHFKTLSPSNQLLVRDLVQALAISGRQTKEPE